MDRKGIFLTNDLKQRRLTMSVQRKIVVSLMLLGSLVYMAGCGAAKRNAQVTPQLKASEWKPKVRELANNMGEYNVYAAGVTKSRPCSQA